MDKAFWTDEQESGPPTIEDDAWYQHHVVSRGYPKVKREPKQLKGQSRLPAWDSPECRDGKHNLCVPEHVLCSCDCHFS